MNVDVLREGAEAVLELIIHDAAHMLNWKRGIKDTTMRGVYHNAEFLAAAEDLGLQWPEGMERIKGKGYSHPVLSDAARERHAADLETLEEIIPVVLPHLAVPSTTRADRTDRLTLRCKCDPRRTFRISRTIAAQGPISCGVCKELFTEE
ncbi:hypothetical protein ACFWMJ_23645 [Streptomyces hawaiiensis]|uniref:hypothetical protein n=1 Tax=Streptomyces hawaiiensis TaxID=67305 RepID=UPI003664C963